MKNHQNRSVLIFGGAGFIGSNLAQYLLDRTEASVHVFDNLSRAGVHRNLEWLRKIAGNSGRLRVTVGDVRDLKLVEKAVASAGEIYHLYSRSSDGFSGEPRRHLQRIGCCSPSGSQSAHSFHLHQQSLR